MTLYVRPQPTAHLGLWVNDSARNVTILTTTDWEGPKAGASNCFMYVVCRPVHVASQDMEHLFPGYKLVSTDSQSGKLEAAKRLAAGGLIVGNGAESRKTSPPRLSCHGGRRGDIRNTYNYHEHGSRTACTGTANTVLFVCF